MLQKLRFGSPGLVCCGSLSVLFLYVVWPWSVCTFSLSRSPDPRCPGLAWCAAPPFLCGWWCWGTLRPPCQADSRHPPAGLAAPRGPAGCGARQAQSLRCLAKCTRRPPPANPPLRRADAGPAPGRSQRARNYLGAQVGAQGRGAPSPEQRLLRSGPQFPRPHLFGLANGSGSCLSVLLRGKGRLVMPRAETG